jgi:hypothetical protein
MGERLHLSPDDPFLRIEKPKVFGITGGCYCCGQQLHIFFENLSILPLVKINNNLFNIVICDYCEQDILDLENLGIPQVSHDILHILQEDLVKLKMDKVFPRNEERIKNLYKLYKKHEKKIKFIKEKNE